MYIKHKLFTILSLLSLTSSALFVTAPAYAQGTSGGGGNFFSGFVDFIAQKLGLEKTQVQNVVNEYKTQQKGKMIQNMQDREKKRLDKLVSDGKITSAQETAIIQELKTLKDKYKLGQKTTETPDQRKANMESFQKDLKAWADSQNIDIKLIEPYGKPVMGKRMGHKGFGMWKGNSQVTPTP